MAKGDEDYTQQLTLNKIQDMLARLEIKIDNLDDRIKAIENLDLKYELESLAQSINRKVDNPSYSYY